MNSDRSRIVFHYLSILTLFNFALAQPLYDLLSRNAEFFVARRSTPSDIILLAFLLSFVLPGILVFMEMILARIHSLAGKIFHACILVVLIALILIPSIKGIEGLPGEQIIIFALLAGICIWFLIKSINALRMFLNFLTPSILIIPALFLMNSSITKLLQGEMKGLTVMPVSSTTPVVLMVLDECPLNSLLDENGEVDAVRYPNFSRFRSSSTWFRNATTVADGTPEAVTAILTGKYPDPSQLPVVKDHPQNLFTLLAGSYELTAFEPITKLCPTSFNVAGEPPKSIQWRMKELFQDLSVVYLHVILPAEYAADLPSVKQTWGDFWNQTHRANVLNPNGYGQRSEQFRRFSELIAPAKRPGLFFQHILLPHIQWEYLPSGNRYDYLAFGPNGVEGFSYAGQVWQNDESVVNRGYQRHLLQLGFVDRLIGRLMDRLKQEGMYDRALIIVTADHGASFQAGGSYRAIDKGNFQDILPVPLFIKFPNQHEKVVNDSNVQSIDIFPTIADALRIKTFWKTDGYSLLKDIPVERTKKRILKTIFTEDKKWLEFALPIPGRQASLNHKIELFGSGSWDHLFRLCNNSSWIDHNVSDAYPRSSDLKIELNRPESFQQVNLHSGFVPVFLSGRVFCKQPPQTPICLGVSVNGVIVGITRTFKADSQVGGLLRAKWLKLPKDFGQTEVSFDKIQGFGILLPESTFRAGKNEVKIIPLPEGQNQNTNSHSKSCCG
jgi:Sulfatase